jgi:O-acetyl-ADP-ribose deacetylase (regulator of RNase III)
MKVVEGDLIELAKQGEFDVIIHGCNCVCVMGAGIARTIKREFPEAYNADLMSGTGMQKLGTYSYANVLDGKLFIVNAYTQNRFGRDRPHLSYEALRKVMKKIKADFGGLRIAYPAIGCGLAGGNWNRVSQIIDEELAGEDHTYAKFIN